MLRTPTGGSAEVGVGGGLVDGLAACRQTAQLFDQRAIGA